jgi:hypothetical protein
MRSEGAAKLCVYKATPGVHALVGSGTRECVVRGTFYPTSIENSSKRRQPNGCNRNRELRLESPRISF